MIPASYKFLCDDGMADDESCCQVTSIHNST